MGRAAGKATGRAGAEHRVELARLQHARKRLVERNRSQLEAGNGLQRGALAASRLLDAALTPCYVGGADAIFVLHEATQPDDGGDLVFGQADELAFQIRGFTDAQV